MPSLTDRQRIELALPACLLFALTDLPGLFVPANPSVAERSEADVAELRANLRTACLEPFADLPPRKQQAVQRRVDRIAQGVFSGWADRSMLGVTLMLWYFLKDLTDREVLNLWEDSAMERATRRLLPMFEHGFAEPDLDAEALRQAGHLLAHLRSEGLYRD